MRAFLLLWFALCGSVAQAQYTLYGPDFRWDGEIQATLTLVNPGETAMAVTIAGFAADGSALGVKTLTLQGLAQYQATARDLFETGAAGWIRVDADAPAAGCVRYDHVDGDRFSLAPLNPLAGSQNLISQPGSASGFISQLAFVNASDAQGGAVAQPFQVSTLADGSAPFQPEQPLAIPNFGAPRQKTLFTYRSLSKRPETLLWDTVRAQGGAVLTSVQHLVGLGAANPALASFTPPRSDYREMVVAAIHPDFNAFRNRLVLINTFKAPLQVDTEAFYAGGERWRGLTLSLQPFERREFNLNDPQELGLPGAAEWYRFTPVEGGLTGYQWIQARDGRALAAAEADVFPASVQALPYTPSNETARAMIGVVNLSEYRERVYILGYNAAGERAASSFVWLDPWEKKLWDAEILFGDQAAAVDWVRVNAPGSRVSSHVLSVRRDGGAAAALLGVPVRANGDLVFLADFEHIDTASLDDKNWRLHLVSDPDRFPSSPRNSYTLLFEEDPRPGDLFVDSQHGAELGNYSLGYETIHGLTGLNRLDRTDDDVVLYASPFFEIPPVGDYRLSFYMRMIDAELATLESEFGVAWRIEGEDRWRWAGLNGVLLLYPPEALSSRRLDLIQYRNRIAEVTEWLPFDVPLPPEVRGKRIQTALYSRFVAGGQEITATPIMLIDRIGVSTQPLPSSFYFEELGAGSFIFEPAP